jgi:hypothetical protein
VELGQSADDGERGQLRFRSEQPSIMTTCGSGIDGFRTRLM